MYSLQWRHNGRHSVSNLHPHDRLLNHLFRHRSKKTSKLRVTGLCAGNSPGTGEFPAQMASNAEHVSIWWRHHGIGIMMGVSGIYYVDCCHYRLHSHVPFMNSFSHGKKWPSLRRKYFQTYFRELKVLYKNLNEVCSWDNGLASNRRQAIIWTNADPIHWHMYAALGRDGSLIANNMD